MLKIIFEIESERIYFSSLSLPKNLEEKIQRVSLLKSSLFSARIEGNPLKLSDMSSIKTTDNKQSEVLNILEAGRFIDKQLKVKNLTKDLLLTLHKKVLDQIQPDAGFFRSQPSAIFNQAGIAVYVAPSPVIIKKLLDKFLDYVNNSKERFPLVQALISHLIFEKIHPFLDGNGRVGRLLIAAILKIKGWNLSFTIPFEEYIDTHKDQYYYYLDTGMQNTNDYLLFMLKAFLEQIKSVRNLIEGELNNNANMFLPPRQEEIYNIIKDHSVISFDIIKRRFLNIPGRTLRYDLKKLLDKGLIEKSGITKGSYYRIKNISAKNSPPGFHLGDDSDTTPGDKF